MKIFSSIFSIGILILSVIPCEDKLYEPIPMQVIETGHQAPLDSHQHGVDYCSPFCVCNCCQSQVYTANTIETTPDVLPSDRITIYNINYTSIQLFDFLIPPKA